MDFRFGASDMIREAFLLCTTLVQGEVPRLLGARAQEDLRGGAAWAGSFVRLGCLKISRGDRGAYCSKFNVKFLGKVTDHSLSSRSKSYTPWINHGGGWPIGLFSEYQTCGELLPAGACI